MIGVLFLLIFLKPAFADVWQEGLTESREFFFGTSRITVITKTAPAAAGENRTDAKTGLLSCAIDSLEKRSGSCRFRHSGKKQTVGFTVKVEGLPDLNQKARLPLNNRTAITIDPSRPNVNDVAQDWLKKGYRAIETGEPDTAFLVGDGKRLLIRRGRRVTVIFQENAAL